MCGSEDELRGGGAVGEWRLEGGSRGEGGGDAGDDLEGDVRGSEGSDLLAGAAEDERISRLQTEDGLAGAGAMDDECMDLRLGDARLAATFRYRKELGGGVGELENLGRDETVGENEGGGGKKAVGAKGKEAGVAGPGTDEVDVSGFGDGVSHLLS